MFSLLALALAAAVVDAAPCENLKAISLPNAEITSVQLVPAGPFTAPNPRGGGPAPAAGGRGAGQATAGRAGGQPPNVAANAQAQAGTILPTFCRIAATLKPSPDSDIRIEVWLPAEHWNGKFEAVGNGGWAGVISYPAM